MDAKIILTLFPRKKKTHENADIALLKLISSLLM